MDISSDTYTSTFSRSSRNLGSVGFVRGGKPEKPEKTPWSKDENQQQTQAIHKAIKTKITKLNKPRTVISIFQPFPDINFFPCSLHSSLISYNSNIKHTSVIMFRYTGFWNTPGTS